MLQTYERRMERRDKHIFILNLVKCNFWLENGLFFGLFLGDFLKVFGFGICSNFGQKFKIIQCTKMYIMLNLGLPKI